MMSIFRYGSVVFCVSMCFFLSNRATVPTESTTTTTTVGINSINHIGHFYVWLCDIVDNAKLLDSGIVDYGYQKALGKPAGLWEGLATYLVIVSEYVESYRGEAFVSNVARFGNELVRFKRNFLRIPIFPQAASLYVAERKRLLLNGEIHNALRLSLLPDLATAAALELKMTGSDKGIW
jgi:hypothetical protein